MENLYSRSAKINRLEEITVSTPLPTAQLTVPSFNLILATRSDFEGYCVDIWSSRLYHLARFPTEPVGHSDAELKAYAEQEYERIKSLFRQGAVVFTNNQEHTAEVVPADLSFRITPPDNFHIDGLSSRARFDINIMPYDSSHFLTSEQGDLLDPHISSTILKCLFSYFAEKCRERTGDVLNFNRATLTEPEQNQHKLSLKTRVYDFDVLARKDARDGSLNYEVTMSLKSENTPIGPYNHHILNSIPDPLSTDLKLWTPHSMTVYTSAPEKPE